MALRNKSTPPRSALFVAKIARAVQETIFSTQLLSIFATSRLKVSTSCQQSRGRRSFSRRQFTTPSLAFSTEGSRSRIFRRSASFERRASSSSFTLLLSRSRDTVVVASTCVVSAAEPGPAKGTRGASRDITGFRPLVLESADPASFASASLFSMSCNVCFSRARMRSSSSATRFWMWSSRVCAREESVCKGNRSCF